MNEDEPILEAATTAAWQRAGQHLTEIIRKHMDHGNIGVLHYTDQIMPLWKRYQDGERTEELFTEIMGAQ